MQTEQKDLENLDLEIRSKIFKNVSLLFLSLYLFITNK